MVDNTRRAVRKRINLPNGSYVYIPVLERIPFSVAADQYQEHIMYLRNGLNTERTVHIRDVPSLDNTEHIQVERIDKFQIKTMAEQAQERVYYVKNLDPPPILPDGTNDPAHERVHYVRYFQNNDTNSDAWVDVELIDKLKITVAAEQYQEWQVFLRHDEPGNVIANPGVNYGPVTVGFCDPSFDLAPGELEIDPPYRLDPFQNIIQFSAEGTAPEPFDALYIGPANNLATPTGWWTVYPESNVHHGVAIGTMYYAGGTNTVPLPAPGVGHIPNNYQIDMRFVDQPFEPHTYHDTSIGTGDVKGFSRSEWDFLWSISSPWLAQGQAWIAANPGVPAPSTFDYSGYGFSSYLGGLFNAWRFGAPGNPIPIVIVRMTAVGPISTDNPTGRY